MKIYVVVDARGDFKKRGKLDDGEFATEHEASQFHQSLPNREDYSVEAFEIGDDD
jgi:hypothetical protein